MCCVYSIMVAICTVLLCCDLPKASRLSPGYISEKDTPDLDNQELPIIYRILHQHPSSLNENEEEHNFEGLLNFRRRGSIRLSVDDTGGFDVIKRIAPPAREWCRIIGYHICRRSLP